MAKPNRTASVERKTGETNVSVSIGLDGTGAGSIETGVGFLDHMLDLFARHGLFDLTVTAAGDTHVDDHHTVEDIGIALGQAFAQALGDKRGIARYACKTLAMDEALTRCSVDISGRPFLVCNADLRSEKIGAFDAQLVPEFLQAFVTHARLTLHVDVLRGSNGHHIAESIFKALARTLREAVAGDPRHNDIPSTKGML